MLLQINLRQLHSFWSNIPLLKGAFFKITLQLNNSSCEISVKASDATTAADASKMNLISVNNPIGGVLPFMISSAEDGQGGVALAPADAAVSDAANKTSSIIANVSVGNKCLNTAIADKLQTGPLSQNIFLYVPAYVKRTTKNRKND